MACALYRDFVLGGVMSGKEPLCSTTHNAILNLIDGKADAVFALLPTEEELSHMAEKEVSLKARCYARDALLILGNAENPVESLASEQLKAIYRGEITNWKELGGPDAPINVYVRDSQSGSQRMFESLVWESEENMPDFSSPAYRDMK
jgi:phosphate transport system substrate-binding protein